MRAHDRIVRMKKKTSVYSQNGKRSAEVRCERAGGPEKFSQVMRELASKRVYSKTKRKAA